ncbi:NAD(P)/FAD-dependent oxidoreductase [Streptomyces spinoverrucosus]|uniref:flavin-containing monooxygenase n=1 Tax=Streptomyces spinoverrucosus TaxID=284043 RepID=UPI0018C3BB64|nr:NAD(P)/FAD-dependent oxidoreductase [Streptomyces spinoverrucosus]MBG0855779.1 NAD(P)/FAD-dependent oxidoreductase [Streptomyces spinoverrucosus]
MSEDTAVDDIRRDVRVAVIGAGFSGIAMGIRLLRKGLHDFVILERAAEVGGVWRDNTYPGVGVDTPSKLYSLSTDPNPHWSRLFAMGDQLFDYTRDVAERRGLLPHIRFEHRVDEARWSPDERLWVIATSKGVYRARFLISAAGVVADPSYPDVPGLEEFPGECFHSARWNHDHDLRGRRVAVIGTGSSSVQFVPLIQPQVAELHVVQRTAAWVRPKVDRPIPERAQRRLRRHPRLMTAERGLFYLITEALAAGRRFGVLRSRFQKTCLKHLQKQVPDPELRRKLLPDFEYMCKRPLISNDYLPALCEPNVTLHTGGLVEVRGNTVLAGDGTKAEVDTLILNTGFDIGVTSPIAQRIHGRGGISLADYWGDDPRGYKGITVPEFPNLFMLQGPNATSGVSSALMFSEAQAVYVADALQRFAKADVETVEVRAERAGAWTRWVRRMSKRTVYEVGGCRSYYLNRKGENVVMWPAWSAGYQLRTRRFDTAAYRVTRAGAARVREEVAS